MKWILPILVSLFLTFGASADSTSLHGSRATMLLDGNPGYKGKDLPLTYLSPQNSAEQRARIRARLKANGDDTIYLYSRSNAGDLSSGRIPQNEWINFEPKLKELNRAGLKPVLWLTPEQRHGFNDQPIESQIQYMTTLANKLDKNVSGYVVCLECDERWSPSYVQRLVTEIKKRTNKPVGVHLSPGNGGFRKNVSYYKNADYIYLQFPHNFGTADREKSIQIAREAVKLGIPVIASEYSTDGSSSVAKALGDELCKVNGVVGTGSGRNVTVCGKEPVSSKKKSSSDGLEKAVVVAAIVGTVIYLLNRNTEDKSLSMDLNSNENVSVMGLTKSYNLTDNDSINLRFEKQTAHNLNEYEDSNRVSIQYRKTW